MRTLVENSKGNSLSYALGALQTYMTQIPESNFLTVGFMDKMIGTILDPNVNASKMALKIINTLTQAPTPNQGAMSYMISKQASFPYAEFLKVIPALDVEGQIGILCFLNNLLKLLHHDKQDEKLWKVLQDVGINAILQVRLNFVSWFF